MKKRLFKLAHLVEAWSNIRCNRLTPVSRCTNRSITSRPIRWAVHVLSLWSFCSLVVCNGKCWRHCMYFASQGVWGFLFSFEVSCCLYLHALQAYVTYQRAWHRQFCQVCHFMLVQCARGRQSLMWLSYVLEMGRFRRHVFDISKKRSPMEYLHDSPCGYRAPSSEDVGVGLHEKETLFLNCDAWRFLHLDWKGVSRFNEILNEGEIPLLLCSDLHHQILWGCCFYV